MTSPRATLPLFGGVHCDTDVLTWTGRCVIGTIPCRIYAPSPLPAWIPSSLGPLAAPLDPQYQKDPDWPAGGWGIINSRRSATIEALGLEYLDHDPPPDLLRFDRDVAHWRTVFQDWLTVLAGGPTAFEERDPGTIWNTKERARDLMYASYYAGDIWEPEAITRWQWEHAFDHSVAGDAAPLSRKLLALATRDAARADGRSAVIHAATAAECALTRGLLRQLQLTALQKRLTSHLARLACWDGV